MGGTEPVGTLSAGAPRTMAQRLRPSVLALVVAAVGLIITAGLALTVRVVNDHNEDRLLRLQVRQTATVLQSFVPTIQTPLASAAEIALTGGGDSAAFRSYVQAFLRTQERFTSVELWRVDRTGALTRLSVIGQAPVLKDTPATRRFLASPSRTSVVGVVGMLGGRDDRLGYAYASAGSGVRYVVYAEDVLPPRHRTVLKKDSPYADLRFALYLGRSRDTSRLLATTESHLPLRGRTAQTTVPFGSTSLTLVAAPVGQLGGRFAAAIWWIILLAGAVIACAAALATERLVRRRRQAEALSTELNVVLQDQRSIAETLQRSLLPDTLPSAPGIEVGARYLPGVNGIEIGGDWYDVIAVDPHRIFFVVGDVSGRGLQAGTVMASLRYAIRAFVSEGHGPAQVLSLVNGLLDFDRDRHFATVLCGLIDGPRAEVTTASAGHLPPILTRPGHASFAPVTGGPPVGVARDAAFPSDTIAIEPGTTLVVYTDGLVERRGESIDDGLERLRVAVAASRAGTADDLLGDIITELTPGGATDDIAILALRWEPVRRQEPVDEPVSHAQAQAI